MTSIRKLSAGVIGGLALLSAQSASAILLDGKTVGYSYLYPTASTSFFNPGPILVGAGVELPGFHSLDDEGTLDISDTSIFIDFQTSLSWEAIEFNGWVITDLFSTIDPFTSISLATNMVGLSLANLAFNANVILVNWQGLSFDENTFVRIGVNSSGVPEPTTMMLLASGLVAAGAAKRKLRNAKL